MKISFVPASLFARLFFLFLAGIAILPVNGAVWQWSVGVKSEKPENGPARAWLSLKITWKKFPFSKIQNSEKLWLI